MRSEPSAATPMLDRSAAGGWSSTPERSTMPLGSPLGAKKSPLTPATVAVADTRRSIAVSGSRPAMTPFESAGARP